MKYMGFRMDSSLFERIELIAKENNMTKSDVVRAALRSYLQYDIDDQWQVTAWQLFDIDAHKVRYALDNSKSASEFFSLVKRWVKGMTLRIQPSTTNTIVNIETEVGEFTAQAPHNLPKVTIIAEIIKQIDQKLIELYDLEE